MASTKKNTKKQDEKHLKILRELCSLPHNKKCFDCGQRGPTYVNMTIGSFVCTSCSGILRGLNPQHRVKSISMTSFTSTEIEFLQNAGNEVCRRSWLGLWNSPNPPEPESRDEIKVKDFMMQKYDRKTWYIPPSQLPPASPKSESSQSLPERKPLKHLLGEGSPTLVVGQEAQPVSRHPPNVSSVVSLAQPAVVQPPKPPANDLLGDLGGDPFAQPAAPAGFNAFGSQPAAPGGGFDVFSSSQPQQQVQQLQQQQQPQQFGGFDPFGSTPQQATSGFNAFSSGVAVQQQQSQPQGFNAFGSQQQPQQAQQQQVGSFNAFSTSPPRPQQQGSFNAFANTQTQQPDVKQNAFGAFGNQPSAAPAPSTFDAFGTFSSTSASQQTKTTSTVGNFGPMVSTSAAGTPSSSSGLGLQSTGDKYAALSDLDSIFKVQTPAPSVGQGSVFSSSSNTSSSLGVTGLSSTSATGLSAGSTAMSSGPNPFANVGNTALPAQSNPFQSPSGGMVQSNGFPGGNAAFGTTMQSSAQSMNFASAGMTAMAANQFSKMGGNQPGMFVNPGGPASMQPSGFNTGQGHLSAGASAQSGAGQFGGAQVVGSQFGASQFGASQFGGSQFSGSQFPGNQFGGAQGVGGQMGGGQFSSGPFGGTAMQPQQQRAFGGISAGMGTNQFVQQQQQQQQQQQFAGGWQQKPQSNPFMASGVHGGLPTQRQSTNPFM